MSLLSTLNWWVTIQFTSVADLDSRIQHKIKRSVWSWDAAHLCFHQPFGTYMMPQSTVMPEPTRQDLPSYHRTVWSRRRCCREAPNQAAVSFAMILVSGVRHSPGGRYGDKNSCNCTKNCIFKVCDDNLANAQTFFVNGTFSVAPHPCKQLYTIRVTVKDVTVTAVCAFLDTLCIPREILSATTQNLGICFFCTENSKIRWRINRFLTWRSRK
jgi:hypothetical protein